MLTVEQLRSMGAQVASMTEAERVVLDNVLDESTEGEGFEQEAQMNAMAQLQNGPVDGQLPVLSGVEAPPIAQTMGGMLPPALPNIITPGQRSATGEGLVTGASVPGSGPVITVRTDMDAMMSDGLMPPFGQGRQPRRNPFRGGMGMGPMMPQMPRYNPMGGNGMVTMPSSMPSAQSTGQITITKLE